MQAIDHTVLFHYVKDEDSPVSDVNYKCYQMHSKPCVYAHKGRVMCVCLINESQRAAEDFCRGKTASTISFICAEM